MLLQNCLIRKESGMAGTMPMFLWSKLVANVIDAIETLTEFTSVRKFISLDRYFIGDL